MELRRSPVLHVPARLQALEQPLLDSWRLREVVGEEPDFWVVGLARAHEGAEGAHGLECGRGLKQFLATEGSALSRSRQRPPKIADSPEGWRLVFSEEV